jgi:RNA polymerase sigma-70 factor (ECF subfamily)
MPPLASSLAPDPLPAADLVALIAGIARRNRTAFADFYDHTGLLVHSVALRIVRNATDAADVTQETYLQIWTHAPAYDPARGTPFAWAVMICRHKAIDHWRALGRQGRLRDKMAAGWAGDFAPAPARTSEENDAATFVHAACATLPPCDRRALELAFFSGRTHREIAALLQEPLGTVKARIRRALLKLRAHPQDRP